MKYSGVEWIGEIPDKWNLVRLKDICINKKEVAGEKSSEYERLALTLNGVIKRPKDDQEGLQPKEFDTYQILEENDFVFKMIDLQNISTSRVGLSPYTGLVSPAYIRFASKKKGQFNEFIHYYLLSLWHNCVYNNIAGDGVRSALNATDMGNLKCPYPTEDQQRKIAGFLNQKTEEIDSLIEIENQQIEKLKEYVESSIYEYLKKELGVSINDMSFESRTSMKKIGALSNLVTKQTGFDYSNTIKPTMLDNPNEDSLPYLQTRNFKNNYFNLNTEFYVPKSTWEQFPKLILDDETLLFSIVGASIGNVAIFPKSEKAFLGGAICRVNLVDKEYALFIKEIMLSKFGQEQIYRKINSNAQGTITVQNVRDFLIPMPSKKDAVRIGQKCESMRKEVDDLITIKEKKIDVLTEYKKSLIYEYVTGKKEVC